MNRSDTIEMAAGRVRSLHRSNWLHKHRKNRSVPSGQQKYFVHGAIDDENCTLRQLCESSATNFA
jgi:hypothetical protein